MNFGIKSLLQIDNSLHMNNHNNYPLPLSDEIVEKIVSAFPTLSETISDTSHRDKRKKLSDDEVFIEEFKAVEIERQVHGAHA